MEIWKEIKGYEGLYLVSNRGNIYSFYRKRLLKPITDKNGYQRVELVNKNKNKRIYIHRIVAIAFLPTAKKERCFINHKDFNTSNNNVDNIEWVTRNENIEYSKIHGRFFPNSETKLKMSLNKRGEKNNRSILCNSDIPKIFEIKKETGLSDRLIVDKFGVNRRVINNILNKKAWINL